MRKQSPTVAVIFCLLTLSSALGLFAACNKTTPPKNPVLEEQKKVLKNKGRMVRDIASPSNMLPAKIEGVSLLEGLADTGADEPPSTWQAMVLQEMQRDQETKKTARQRIASLSTAVVILTTIVPPGARKGDRLDVTVTFPPNSQAKSMEGGYIEKGRLAEIIGTDVIHKGSVNGLVAGRVTLDPDLIERGSPVALKQGKIIGGAILVRPREIWLTIREEERSSGVAQRVEDVINNRFSYRHNGSKRKVAEAKSGAARVNLVVPEEYRENINRYVNVVCEIAFFETPDELNRRIGELREKLLDPGTSEVASLQLEAIGPTNELAVDAVRDGMKSPIEAVRYHSAVAMAYLDVSQDRAAAARILADLGRDNALLRPSCMAVLGTCLKKSGEADAALRKLLSANSNETRYGAFRALWTRDPQDYMIQGEHLGGAFGYHCLNCQGTPMVHVTMSRRPEIVLFSKENLRLQGEFEIDAGKRITVRTQGGEVIVKRYQSGIDEQRITGFSLDEVIRAIVDVGGGYPDVVQFLVAAKKNGTLVAVSGNASQPAALAFDALPGANSVAFKRIRDADELAEAEARLAPKKEEPSFWGKMNPTRWFSKDEEEEDYTKTFSDEEPTEEVAAEKEEQPR